MMLPYTSEAVTVKDFRLISLIHLFSKLIFKVLAKRFTPKLSELVHCNQSAFIKGRFIQYNFRIVQLTAKLLHAHRRPSFLLKIDIARAFDSPFFWKSYSIWASIEDGVTRLLQSFLQPVHALSWTAIRVTEFAMPEGSIKMILFRLMEVLNGLLLKADEWKLLHPFGMCPLTHRASLYADDLIVFVSPETQDLTVLRRVLELFKESSGLGCILAKCLMVAICCSEEQVQNSALHFPCEVAQFAIRYLGLPLSVMKLPKAVLQPLMDRVADKLPTWKGQLLHHSDRLALIKVTLTTIPIYMAISVGLWQWLLKGIHKICKYFLWTGFDLVQNSKCMVAWSGVQRPLHLGGLGVLDLRLLGLALRVRWLWLERVEPSCPCAAFLVGANKATTTFFKASISLVLGNGNAFLFWTDPWLHGQSIADLAPDLLDVIPLTRRKHRSVASAINDGVWTQDILGPLTDPMLMQFLDIHSRIQQVHLSPAIDDKFIRKWSSSGKYSSSLAYSALFLGQTVIEGAKQLWKTKAPNKARFFMWLVLLWRCWTSEQLRRHGLRSDDSCAICSQGV
jgi:hypothetical protein